jgi:hypothetical protein
VGDECANEGTATRIDNRQQRIDSNGLKSTTDVNFVSDNIINRTSWTVSEDAETDHLPVLTEIAVGPDIPPPRSSKYWCLKKADWEKYRSEVKRRLELDPDPIVPGER